MSKKFWDQKTTDSNNITITPDQVVDRNTITLDAQAVAEIQDDPEFDVFEDEEDDTAEIMSDANLRLEQGRLYQMVLQGNIFADTNADPKAIRNVHREIRKFVRERMETMLGIRQEQPAQDTVISSPFNDLEVTVLKMLASKMSKGATEQSAQQESGPQLPPPTPKKDGITSISGNLRPQTTPVSLNKSSKNQTRPAQKTSAPKQATPKSAIDNADGSALEKPIDQMTPQELAAHDAAAVERRKKNYAKIPNNLTPHPTPRQLEALYTVAAANATIANPWRASGQS